MAVTTYMDLIEQMKALADKINKHYDSVTLETEIPIEDEKTRILREAGILEDEETDIEGLASRAIAAVTDLAQEAGAEMNVSVSTGDDEMPPEDDGEYHTELGDDEVEEGIRIEPRTGVQSRGEQKKVATDFAKIQKAYPLGMQNMPAPNTRHHGIAKKSRQNRAKKGQTTPAVGYDPT